MLKKLTLGTTLLLSLPALASASPMMTRDTGAPVGDNQNSDTAGNDGPVLLEDMNLVEKLARFDRERIPERVVHAQGVGAQGYFVTTTDFSKYTSAAIFAKPGIKTPVFVRFSTVMGERGSPEAARDPRGFAVKFYTTQGNWDIVGINHPVFFIRDAIKFPDFVHANKPSPVTNVQDPNRAFDFFSHEPESTDMLTRLYSDTYGMPASYREMDGYGVHAFRLINAQGQQIFAKFHWKSEQGIQGMTLEQAREADPYYATRDLYNNIKAGHFPKWDLYIQLMTPQQVAKLNYDAFDDTKAWEGVPEVKVGTMTLDKIPPNFFEYTEESAFCPCELVPGIQPSPDKMLQGRLFAYADTQRYRIGTNYMQLPVNRPLVAVHSDNWDGDMDTADQTGDVNYEPTDDAQYPVEATNYRYSPYQVQGMTQQKPVDPQDDFTQAGDVYRSYDPVQQADLIHNLAADLNQVHSYKIKETMVSYFYRADHDYGTRLAAAIKVNMNDVIKLVAMPTVGVNMDNAQ
jgi:catalase